MNDLIYLIIFVVSISRVMYYAIGEPSHNYNPQSILAGYVKYISFRKCVLNGVWKDLYIQETDVCLSQGFDKIHQNQLKFEMRKAWLNRASILFTYEFILGICPICTFFWVSILFILLPSIFILKLPILLSLAGFGISNIFFKTTIKYI